MNDETAEIQRKKLNDLSHRVIGLCVEVHRELGPGLLESAYEEALAYELSQADIAFQRQIELPLQYKGTQLNCGYRIDFIIEGELIIELKATNELLAVHHAQILTYLKLQRRSLGLLVNFNVPVLKNGIRRVVAGELFRREKRFRSDIVNLLALVCASIPLWFRSQG